MSNDIDIGFVVNSDECLLTRMQEMSLDYHFTVEQEVGSATHAFFGFNGELIFFQGPSLYNCIFCFSGLTCAKTVCVFSWPNAKNWFRL